MKKGIVIVSAVAVVAITGAFVANNVKDKNIEEETTTEYVQQNEDYDYDEEYDYADDNEDTSEAVSETTADDTTTIPDKTEWTVLSTEEILDKIKRHPSGTAGSSIKIISVAVDFINYAENTTDDEQTINDKFASFKREMSSAKYEEYLDNLYSVFSVVKSMYEGNNPEWFKSVDYTILTEDGSFSLEKVEKIYNAFGGE